MSLFLAIIIKKKKKEKVICEPELVGISFMLMALSVDSSFKKPYASFEQQ